MLTLLSITRAAALASILLVAPLTVDTSPAEGRTLSVREAMACGPRWACVYAPRHLCPTPDGGYKRGYKLVDLDDPLG